MANFVDRLSVYIENEDPQCGWQIEICSVTNEPDLQVNLFWADKQLPTHRFLLPRSMVRRLCSHGTLDSDPDKTN